MTHVLRGLAAGLLLLLVFVCGCGSDGRTKLAPVKGRVVYKDQGVTAAEIYFLPDAEKGNQGTMASAILQEDGSFEMVTHPDRKGVAPGAYKVTFGLGRRQEKELDKYRKAETTPYRVEVPEEGLPNKVFDLSHPDK
jgi:hypothetical protein